ncbi:MAG: HPr family phosphocarrier protein [Pseudomonadota bacterium]
MPEQTVTICNRLGLHARAAARLFKTASAFECDVRLKNDDREVNAKSIMGVMMLAAAKGTELTLVADGPDAEAALEAISALIADRFGEDE